MGGKRISQINSTSHRVLQECSNREVVTSVKGEKALF